MKIGLMADSHDNLPLIAKAVEGFASHGCEVILHCGDIIAPFSAKALLRFRGQVVGVFGNNDGERAGIRRALPEVFDGPHVFEFGGRRIMAVHDRADAPASPQVDVIVFGHSHEKMLAPGPPLEINPGEAGGWLRNEPSAAVLETDTLQVDWIDL